MRRCRAMPSTEVEVEVPLEEALLIEATIQNFREVVSASHAKRGPINPSQLLAKRVTTQQLPFLVAILEEELSSSFRPPQVSK